MYYRRRTLLSPNDALEVRLEVGHSSVKDSVRYVQSNFPSLELIEFICYCTRTGFSSTPELNQSQLSSDVLGVVIAHIQGQPS